jgi:pimeloyl-ACP methyl ester carboxylesterase
MSYSGYIDKDLWRNGSSPLVFLLPGGTGTKRPEMRGADAMAAMFWLYGYNAYVFAASGQDGRSGSYCMQQFLSEAQAILTALTNELAPSRIILFGSCAGGAIAGHLATQTDRETVLALWEAPVHYTDTDIHTFIARATVPLAGNFEETLVHLDSALPQIACPVLIAYGPPVPSESAVFRHDDIQTTERALRRLSPHQVERIFIPGSDHNLTRGSSPQALRTLVKCTYEFAERHTKHTL